MLGRMSPISCRSLGQGGDRLPIRLKTHPTRRLESLWDGTRKEVLSMAALQAVALQCFGRYLAMLGKAYSSANDDGCSRQSTDRACSSSWHVLS